MPKSRVRKKKADIYVRPAELAPKKRKPPSPRWFGVLVLGLMLIGVVWLVIYYVTQGALPVDKFQAWNVVVGFSFIAFGFALATQWR